MGSNSITVWLSDGSCFPGQLNFRKAFQNTLDGLQKIYAALPDDWKMFVEYKAFEPNFYSMTVGDWGQSLLYAQKLGPKAYTLVDLGHHLPNANIEQIVSLLLMEGKLGGFHFNDSKYGDDDLTVGSINPYQLFLIFNELVEGMDARHMDHTSDLGWMIDASHNVKDPLEDLLQSIMALDTQDKVCKQFKLDRIGAIIQMGTAFQYEGLHKKNQTDIFGFTGDSETWVTLHLSLRAYLLLREEYPLSTPYTERTETGYQFHGPVSNLEGIGRFVLGLMDEIQIEGPEMFSAFIRNKFASHKLLPAGK